MRITAAPFKATGTNPLTEAFGLLHVLRQVRKTKPDVIHTASPKGNLYGGIAARLCGVPKLVIAVSGQGYLFTGNAGPVKRGIGALYNALIKWVYRHPNCTVIVQNQDDFTALLGAGMLRREQLALIPGSGVDLALFADMPPERCRKYRAAACAHAARQGRAGVRGRGACAKADAPGLALRAGRRRRLRQPQCLFTSSRYMAWVEEGIVEWWDYQADMPAVYRQTAIVCLPSYREGMPKCLLEAAAAGKPVVTTDVIGCREAILPGETGLLVPVKDAAALRDALAQLIDNPSNASNIRRQGQTIGAAEIFHRCRH